MKVFLIFGPPGAGKGTQGELLAKNGKVRHLSTGEILRKNISEKTPIGLKAKGYMDQGHLVPDEILNTMISDFISTYKDSSPVLLDGYPRTLDQGKFLFDQLNKSKSFPVEVFNIVLEDNEIVERLMKRGRADDSRETISVRIKTYHNQTKPLLDLFKEFQKEKKCLTHNINGKQSVDQVLNDISKII